MCASGRWAIGILVAAGLAGTSTAAPIDDISFFTSIPHTLINFESDGSGAPVSLIQGETMPMPANEYAAFGVSFNIPIFWANDGNSAFDAAQLLGGGSPVNSIPSAAINSFEILFTTPIRAAGLWVCNNRLADAAGPLFTAFNSSGQMIDSAQFGAAFIDGTRTNQNTTADYGFMGIHSPNEDIARIVITKQAAILDNLMFSPVPAPGALALAALGCTILNRRTRRA